jgi:hypothetical protein
MKTKAFKIGIVTFITVILVFFVSGFAFNSDSGGRTTDLTKNEQLKKNVFHQITNNRELFIEFMNNMMENPQSMNWMMTDGTMMQYMFSGDHLGYMMHNNPGINQLMMRNMMNTIYSDSTYANQWNQMMNNHQYGMHHRGMMMYN